MDGLWPWPMTVFKQRNFFSDYVYTQCLTTLNEWVPTEALTILTLGGQTLQGIPFDQGGYPEKSIWGRRCSSTKLKSDSRGHLNHYT